jgi:hypothetical protein
MKRFILLLILVLGLVTVQAQPFKGKTKTKPVYKMSKRQIKNAQTAKTFYYRHHNKMKKR